jgi:glycosyltransferase involved in cell wall biosynthesis
MVPRGKVVMKILYVMPSILHPTIRGELRHYHFLTRLAREHEITLIVLKSNDIPVEVIDEMLQYTSHLVRVGEPPPPRPARRGIAGAMASLRWRMRKARVYRRGIEEMKQYADRLVRGGGFDLLLVSGSDLYPIAEEMVDTPMVVDWCDTDSVRMRLALRHTGLLEWPLRFLRYHQMRRVEQRLFRKLRHVTFVSRRDRDAAGGVARRGTIIPNGCDLGYWRRGGGERGTRIVFTGVLDYAPNADAANYLVSAIAPLVRQEIPDLEVIIAGRNPSPDMLALASRTPGVTVTGSVPDLRPYLESAAVFVAPLRFASGMQNKILEAMAMELPVVTTPVAAEGFRVDGDEEPPLLVGSDAREIAAHIARVIRDPRTAQRLGADGRRYVHQHCDWERSAHMLDQLCRQVATISSAPQEHDIDIHRYRPIQSTRSSNSVVHPSA